MPHTLLAPLPAELADERVWLRLITVDDWPVEVALSALPDVVRWTRYPPGLDETAAGARIAARITAAAAGLGGRYVVRDQTGLAAGTAGVAMNHQGAPEVFYALLPAGRGRGLATAATVQLTEWALSVGHDVVALKTMLGNTASEAVARRSGFAAVAVETAAEGDTTVQLRRWERVRALPRGDALPAHRDRARRSPLSHRAARDPHTGMAARDGHKES